MSEHSEGLPTKVGYMCKTDYDHHLESAYHPSMVYTSVEGLREQRLCVRSGECGIVEVEVRLRRVVEEGTI